MENTTKESLRELIEQNKIKKAFEKFLEKVDNTHLQNRVINLSREFNELEQKQLENTIYSQDYYTRKNQICTSLLATIDIFFQHYQASQLSIKSNKEYIITSEELEDLKNRLLYFLKKNDISSTIKLIKKLLSPASEALVVLKSVESEIIKNYSRYSFAVSKTKSFNAEKSYKDWKARKESLKKRVENIIDNLKVSEIVSGKNTWNIILLQEKLVLKKEEFKSTIDIYGLFTPADEIVIPNNLEMDVRGMAFRRLLHRCQDALAVENFDEAYNCCLEIRDTLEPKSAQLYEYLLLVYSKKETIENIISKTLEGDESPIKHIILYIGRYYQFQKNKEGISWTGDDNIDEIINGLSQGLKQSYAGIKANYIWDNENEVVISRNKVDRCINAALNVFYAIPEAKPMSFLEIAINELSGGGKLRWIEPVDRVLNGWSLKDIHSNAINKIKEIFIIYEERSTDVLELTESKESKANEFYDIALTNLVESLNYKYNLIKTTIDEDKYWLYLKKEKQDMYLQAVIQLMNMHIVAYEVFGKEKLFLNLPIEELMGNGIFKWAIFDSNGYLIENKDTEKYGFKAIKELSHMVNLKYGENTWNIYQKLLIEETYKRIEKEVADKYIHLKKLSKIKTLSDKDLEEIIHCLKQWEILYFLNQDEKILNNYLNELIGSGMLLWFDVDDNNIIANEVAKKLNFQPDHMLKRVFKKIDEDKIELFKSKLASNLFKRVIISNYKNINKNFDENRTLLLNLLQKTLNIYKTIYPDVELLNFIYDELIQETKFQWFDIKNDAIVTFEKAKPYELEFILVYQEFEELVLKIKLFSKEKLKFEKTNKRFQEAQYSYDNDIKELKSQNGIREMETAIKIIRKCYSCFKVYQDSRFLDIPKKEILNLDKTGKIKWSYKIGRLEFPTFIGLAGGIFEDYLKEKYYLHKILNSNILSSNDDRLILKQLIKDKTYRKD